VPWRARYDAQICRKSFNPARLADLERRYLAGALRVPVDHSRRIGELEQEIRNVGDAIAKACGRIRKRPRCSAKLRRHHRKTGSTTRSRNTKNKNNRCTRNSIARNLRRNKNSNTNTHAEATPISCCSSRVRRTIAR
jgi:hypothetical protein